MKIKQQELTVIIKTYDLILWSCHHTGRFPRKHRFVLGERIERNLYGFLEILIHARYSRDRETLLYAERWKGQALFVVSFLFLLFLLTVECLASLLPRSSPSIWAPFCPLSSRSSWYNQQVV